MENPESSKKNPANSLSRITPLALVIGAAGFLGSHLCEELLSSGFQVIGVDNLATGMKENIVSLHKDKRFLFLNSSILEQLEISLPRLDYAFFVADDTEPKLLLTKGLDNFLHFLQEFKEKTTKSEEKQIHLPGRPKVVLVSSTDLYDSAMEPTLKELKAAEGRFANFVKKHNLNARLIRLAPLYGPRMHFRTKDALVRLIHSALKGNIHKEQTSVDFITRAIYIKDAVHLLIRSVMVGSTAMKIYDGALLHPLKVTDIKQVLLDPLWYEERGFTHEQLPPWPTPNLLKTHKELSWKAKTPLISSLKQTIAYFKDNSINVDDIKEQEEPEVEQVSTLPAQESPWANKRLFEDLPPPSSEQKPMQRKVWTKGIKKLVIPLFGLMLIFFGLIWPAGNLAFNLVGINYKLTLAEQEVSKGDFNKASSQITEIGESVDDLRRVLDGLAVFKRLGLFKEYLLLSEEFVDVTKLSLNGVEHALIGSAALVQATQVISGESDEKLEPLYEKAKLELADASGDLSQASLALGEINKREGSLYAGLGRSLSQKITTYSQYAQLSYMSALLAPDVTALEGKKNYLVVLYNPKLARPGGGQVVSVGRVIFEKGRVVDIKTYQASELNNKISTPLKAPEELGKDLNLESWQIGDSLSEIDFPTSARQVEYFYSKATGEKINGMIAINPDLLTAALQALGSSPSQNNQELPALHSELLSKIFFLKEKDYALIASLFSNALRQKQAAIYLADPQLFSYAQAQNYTAILPREGEKGDQLRDLFALSVTNLGLKPHRDPEEVTLNTAISQEGVISHQASVPFKNPDQESYKLRMKLYLPVGTKMKKARLDEGEQSFNTYSDYGRAVYSLMIEIPPQTTKTLQLEYELNDQLLFKDNNASLGLEVVKQLGAGEIPFLWNIKYPPNFKAMTTSEEQSSGENMLQFSSKLDFDKTILVNFTK